MQTCILTWSASLLEWQCMVSPSQSSLTQSSVHLACLDWILIFLPSLRRYRLSLKESCDHLNHPLRCPSSFSFLYLYCWIFQASIDRCYIPHLFFLLLYTSYRDLAINYSINSWHSHKLVVQYWPGYSWYFDLLSRLLFFIERSSFCVPCFLYPWGCKFWDQQCQECLIGLELLG